MRHAQRAGDGITLNHAASIESKPVVTSLELTLSPALRRVVYCCKETGKTYEFLTNHFRLAAKTIAGIYKDR